jgi:hypothetical protein
MPLRFRQEIQKVLYNETMKEVQFNFTLSQEDAENLANILHDEIVRHKEHKLHAIMQEKTYEVEWFEKHIAYITDLNKTVMQGSSLIEEPKEQIKHVALCHKCSDKMVQPDMLDEKCHIIAGCKQMTKKEWESNAPCPASGHPRM